MDKGHMAVGAPSYEAIPAAANNGVPTTQELASFKYPDWYRNDYLPGRLFEGPGD